MQFGNADQREVADRTVGAVQHKEVRKLRNGNREIGNRMVRPYVVKIDTAPAAHQGRSNKSVGPKAGRQHQDVQFVQFAILSPNAFGFNGFNTGDHEFGVRVLNALIEIGRQNETLTRRPVIWPEFLA